MPQPREWPTRIRRPWGLAARGFGVAAVLLIGGSTAAAQTLTEALTYADGNPLGTPGEHKHHTKAPAKLTLTSVIAALPLAPRVKPSMDCSAKRQQPIVCPTHHQGRGKP